MSVLTLCLKKRSDGGSALTLERADGSRVWQRQDRHAEFFASHDLTHYAVESVLGIRHAFYGLIADGWDFSSFEKPWPRGPLPADALWVERFVSLLDVERFQRSVGGDQFTAAECNEQLGDAVMRTLTEGDLEAIRACRDECFVAWEATPVGETLSLRLLLTPSAEPGA